MNFKKKHMQIVYNIKLHIWKLINWFMIYLFIIDHIDKSCNFLWNSKKKKKHKKNRETHMQIDKHHNCTFKCQWFCETSYIIGHIVDSCHCLWNNIMYSYNHTCQDKNLCNFTLNLHIWKSVYTHFIIDQIVNLCAWLRNTYR